MSTDAYKRMAAEQAMTFIDDGMRLGLGTGSTAAHFVELLAERVADGLKVVGVPTSEQTRAQAEHLGVPLTTLNDAPFLDLTVDGADEIDGNLRLIKGGGGALLREKIVATASERMVVIADGSKFVETLGAFPLPVEIVRFGANATVQMVQMLAQEAGCNGEIELRRKADGAEFVTDENHLILDCSFDRIADPVALDEALKMIPGVVENGLFLGLADAAILGGEEGVRVLDGGDDAKD
ncbi:MAG: ribose-5-phosphate isomerase RpiA [Pseudomonadota bacterium]